MMIVQRYIRKRSVFSKAILINRKIGRMDMAASSDAIELCILIFQIAFMKQDYVFSFAAGSFAEQRYAIPFRVCCLFRQADPG